MFLFLFLSFVLTLPRPAECDDNKLLVMFWNLENFFDWKDGSKGKSDAEFSSLGKRHWTMSRFYRKCDAAAKAVTWIGDKYGKIPDVIGLCEIENRGVLYKWLSNTILRKFDYSIVHFDSSDKRGIDVALLYRKSLFDFYAYSRRVPSQDGVKLNTRDILEVSLKRLKTSQLYHFIVNHHPSKFGGGKTSDSRRYSAMEALKALSDSLIELNSSAKIVAMGDFNDNPDGEQFDLLSGSLVNKSISLHQQGSGTIRFQGTWDLIDMFLVNKDLSSFSTMDIIQVPFLMVWDNSYPGFKPFRTYSGPRYIGGVSDHCPIVLIINEQH